MNIIVFIRFYFIFSFFINSNLNLDETPRNLRRFLLSSLVKMSKFCEIRPDFVGIVNPGNYNLCPGACLETATFLGRVERYLATRIFRSSFKILLGLLPVCCFEFLQYKRVRAFSIGTFFRHVPSCLFYLSNLSIAYLGTFLDGGSNILLQ